MKLVLDENELPVNAYLIACANYEDRCFAVLDRLSKSVRGLRVILCEYPNAKTSDRSRCKTVCGELPRSTEITYVEFDDRNPTKTFRSGEGGLIDCLTRINDASLIIDISVLSKQILLLLLRCIDDLGLWEKLWLVYTEPENYEIEGNLPLSFGLASVAHLPGFLTSPNPSRPVHASLFLGYEGDRAFATYELLQPQRTTVVIPDPPFRPEWVGRTESQNSNLLAITGDGCAEKASALDPESTFRVLCSVFGDPKCRSEYNRTICPLGTKPQAVGAYFYVRECIDPPSMIYSKSLRLNHKFYSRGVGPTWLVHRPT